MDTKHPVDYSFQPVGCQHCHFIDLCQRVKISEQERQILEHIRFKTRKFDRGEFLFRANDKLKNVYVIRSGSAKTYTYAHDGQEQVTGFHLAGKLLGLDAIGNEYHIQSAVTLETCSVCEIPFARLEYASKDKPQLQSLLLRAMSNEIRDDHYQLALLSRKSAAARLASFLLYLSHHFRQLGYSTSNFNLSLSRHDIANLLGLAVETVSRLFTQFQEEELITADRKHIILDDMEGLKKLAHSSDEHTRQPVRQPVRQRVYSQAQPSG